MNYTTEDYLTQLQQDKEDLIDNLEIKGITGLTGDETFTELVPEVLNIPSGGGKYAPRVINFQNYHGAELNYEVSNLDTSNVTQLRSTFAADDNLTSLDLSGWDVSNVTAMVGTFDTCMSLTTLNLSTWSPLVTHTTNMFTSCTALRYLDVRSFDFTGVQYSTNMFGANANSYVPANCEIIVADATQKTWFNTNFSRLTNVKTVAEYEAEQA